MVFINKMKRDIQRKSAKELKPIKTEVKIDNKKETLTFPRKTKAKKYIYNDGKMWFISPLYYKSNDWVMKYFIENDIKRSPVYETLHISGDCLCGCFAKKEELKLLEMFHPEVFTEIKRLEKLVKEKGSPEAKENSVWGIHNQTTESVEAQDNLEAYVCSECFFDNTGKEADTKRFNDEMEDIDKKLVKMKNDT